ncbi:MAG TPA: bifunctional (p)ppGpp synthetase/guanosine-3',5'-bis(diphosphate) 3'-pyrophosphohydrolase, partial [Alphaproteobacteria bacterium]|nr:bifunctional (p)ppGpp synthetase/guanosine-3',5'-bis(diphosphate) 3'-pyrophosphohydrolase [Alphaproteobacteria bacterium]
MIRQFELVEQVCSYDFNADEDALNRAYVYSMKAHGRQIRDSGDPYFSHPLEVAGILTDYKLDSASIITALLHDVVEDTPATAKEIKGLFGDEVARLVDGVTKLTRIELQSDQAKQAENFRKLVLAMSDDIRVLLIKLADRLHNMRTLHYVKSAEKRRRVALETMEIYAPLAERIGMQEMKSELEDLSFAELNPEAHASITSRLEFLCSEGGDVVSRIIDDIHKTLAGHKVKSKILGREKHPYSIWRKMQRQNIGFEQFSDIMAFRIIVDNIDDCYRALGVIHGAYPVIPDRFKDYISTPKPNGYQSLHTGVFWPERQRVEIQIRTLDMDEIAEYGVAAHWQYKRGEGYTDGRRYRWLRELLEILEHASGPEEFLENTKLEMFQDQVFCFSPKGDLINLPHGATPVDFAYAVHSEIGDRCVGAKINGLMMPLRTRLANGDQVEIVTSKAQTPSPAWESFIVTGKARSCIRRFVRSQEKEQYLRLGRKMLKKAFREEDYEFTGKALKGVLKVFKQNSPDDICSQVGAGNINARKVLEAVFPGIKKKGKGGKAASRAAAKGKKRKKSAKDTISIKGLIPGMAMHYAECCHPLPGDRIVGILTTGKGVTVHTIDCDMLETYNDQPERWLDVSWEMPEREGISELHVGRLHLTLVNEPGSLGSLSMAIAKSEGNISNLKVTHRTSEFFDLLIDIEVLDVKHLTNIIAA